MLCLAIQSSFLESSGTLLQKDGAAVLVEEDRGESPRVAVGLTEEPHPLLPKPLVGCTDVVCAKRQYRRSVGSPHHGLLVLLLRFFQDDPGGYPLGRDRDPACAAFAVGLVLAHLEAELVGVELHSGLLVVDEDPGERHVLEHPSAPFLLFAWVLLPFTHTSVKQHSRNGIDSGFRERCWNAGGGPR